MPRPFPSLWDPSRGPKPSRRSKNGLFEVSRWDQSVCSEPFPGGASGAAGTVAAGSTVPGPPGTGAAESTVAGAPGLGTNAGDAFGASGASGIAGTGAVRSTVAGAAFFTQNATEGSNIR